MSGMCQFHVAEKKFHVAEKVDFSDEYSGICDQIGVTNTYTGVETKVLQVDISRDKGSGGGEREGKRGSRGGGGMDRGRNGGRDERRARRRRHKAMER